MWRDLPIFKRRENGLRPTNTNRATMGGQVVKNAGGIVSRKAGIELKANIDSVIYNDLYLGRHTIAQKVPFFIEFTCEYPKYIPFQWFYGFDDQEVLLQSGIDKFLNSKRLVLIEAF